MSNRSVFHELARYMPEHEREALLARLRQSLHSESEESEIRRHRDMGEQEREQRIVKDMEQLTLFARFILWIRSKLGGKSVREAFIAMRLKGFKRTINNLYPGITGFETRDLSPKFADDIFRLFALSVPLKPLFQRAWTDPIDLQHLIIGVLESRISGVKREVTEILTFERMEEIVGISGSRESLKNEATKRLDEYVSAIPNTVFASVQEDLKPFERTRDIVLYPYTSFFQLFHFTPLEEDIHKKTYFKSASVMLCLEHLEELHYALYAASTIPEGYELASDVLLSLQIARDASRTSEVGELSVPGESDMDNPGAKPQEPGDPGDGEDSASSVELDPATGELLGKLIDRCRTLYQRVPFEALLRYFMKDPYYELVHAVNETPVKELYVSVLRLRFMADLDRLYPELRRRVVEKEVDALFAGKTMRTFRNYRDYQSIDYQKLGLPYFMHTRSVGLLFNYVGWFYKSYILEVIQLLDRNVLGQNRITRDRLIQYAQAVDDITERIRLFDYSLSSDSEDGRTFQRLRFTLAQDTGHQKIYRSLVIQKDREARSIIERSIESLSGLVRVFQDLLESASPNIRTSMQNHYFMKGQPVSLDSIVRERVDHIQKFLRLLDQVVRIERG